MSRKILFFINPISGTKSKLPLEKNIVSRCAEKGISFEILHTTKEGNYDFLKEKIQKEGITDVVICGGDGSLSPIIASLLQSDVNMGILPLGSGNGLARAAGIPQSVHKALDIIFHGKAQYVDAILINNQLSCHLSGLGFDAQVAHDFSKQKNRGLHSYVKQVFKNFLKTTFWNFEIEIGGKVFKEQAFCVCIANSNQFGNNFTIAPKASLTDGLLDIIIVKKTSKPMMLFEIVKQVLAGKIKRIDEKGLGKKNIFYFQAKQLKIKNPDNAPMHIDGDPNASAPEFFIEVLPSAYRLIQGV